MERMNEILARAASRRVSTRRMPTPAPSTTILASTPAASSVSLSKPRRLPANQPASKATGAPSPLHLGTDADIGQPAQPAADVLDNDRILELPSRPARSIVRPADVFPGAMSTIRELTAKYAAQPEPSQPSQPSQPQRVGRAASPATPASSVRHENSALPAATPASTGRSARVPGASASGASKTGAQSGRAARAAKTNAPGVCPLCHGAGYVRLDVPVGDPAFGQAIRCQCKEQQLEERDRGNLRRLSNLDPFREKTFETFDASPPGLREAFDIARHYADDPMGWLVFRGGYGCGKTHLAAAIANVAEQNGVPVVFAIVPDLLDHLRATFAPNSDTPYDALFDKVREVQLLVLDDFGAENSTAWATEKLFQLINYRYNYRMPTVITTNHRLLSHMDERIRSRLSDLGLVRHVAIEAADFRERHTGRSARGTGRSRSR